ncbi:MAG: PIG-L family deacetylase [Thermoanaerobaculia bacterium]
MSADSSLPGQGGRARVKSLLRDVSQHSFFLLWSAAFGMTGRVLRPRARIDEPTGGHRVMVIAPHPDDEVAGCGGTICEHRRAGDRVTVACVTDGRRSTAFGLGPDEMAARRRQEAGEAAAVLDVDLEWLGLPEGEWRPEELVERLRALLAEIRPDIVYAPSRIDFHFEHERVARALASALVGGEPPWTVRVYAIQVPLTPVLTNVIVPVQGMRTVEKALSCYRTQMGSLQCTLRPKRYAARLYDTEGPVEEFWELAPEEYRQLHLQPRKRPLVKTFRGLRYDAASDPLAYLRGLKERWSLARKARKARR